VRNHATINHAKGDYTRDQFIAAAELFADCPVGTVCEAMMVVCAHSADGHHELKVVQSDERTPESVAHYLMHAAAHVQGDCRDCERAKKRGARGSAQ